MSSTRDEGEKEYIQIVIETAKAMWGPEQVKTLQQHFQTTAKAVYAVSNYPLKPEEEPITTLKPEEK